MRDTQAERLTEAAILVQKSTNSDPLYRCTLYFFVRNCTDMYRVPWNPDLSECESLRGGVRGIIYIAARMSCYADWGGVLQCKNISYPTLVGYPILARIRMLGTVQYSTVQYSTVQ